MLLLQKNMFKDLCKVESGDVVQFKVCQHRNRAKFQAAPPQWAILEKFEQKLIFEFKVVVKIIKVASRYIFFYFCHK
jgi:hypothetical protein